MNPNDLNEQDREGVADIMQIADNLDFIHRLLRWQYYRRNYMVRRGKWGRAQNREVGQRRGKAGIPGILLRREDQSSEGG